MLSPLKSIRVKCLDCCCGQAIEVRYCPSVACALYPYRMGHNPNRKGIGKFVTEGKNDEIELANDQIE